MEEKTSPQVVKDLNRSNAHPVVTLPDSFQFVTKIYTDLGYTNHHDKNAIATVYGLSYDSIKQRLSTSGQYNLLDLKHGTGYKVTSLFLKLYRPENDNEKREAALECLRSPTLYDKLISEYDGHNLPSQVGLSTTLFRRYSLNEKSAEKAAQVFLENMRIYELVTADNVLRFNVTPSVQSAATDFDNSEVVFTTLNSKPQKMIEYIDTTIPNFLEIPIRMKDGSKAFIKIPETAEPEDYQRIAKVIQGYI